MVKHILIFRCALALVALPAVSRAQNSDPHHSGLALTGGFAALPGAFQWGCGNRVNGGGALSFELGGAALYRVRPWMLLQADTRFNKQIMHGGCTLVLPAAETTYDRGLSRFGFVTSTFRVGVETPPTLPIVLVRATAGAGFAWSAPVLPVTAVSVGLGAHNRAARFLMEWERMQTWAHATERTWFPASNAGDRRIVAHPVWYAVRFGVELPLGGLSTERAPASAESP